MANSHLGSFIPTQQQSYRWIFYNQLQHVLLCLVFFLNKMTIFVQIKKKACMLYFILLNGHSLSLPLVAKKIF
uniref:Uncharacterized protein n=1 Tax=Anguilla anguilla TaxID=7936 RepID=A0A0E9Y074_ANGAN